MMRITTGKNAEGLVKYFSGSLLKDDYFFTGTNTKGYWYGQLRADLNLPKEVSQKTFSKLAHGLNPDTEKHLTLRQNKDRRTSIEYMFSAPKSVSLILALSDEKTAWDILNKHRLAVRKAMAEIERDMQTQTTIEGRKVYVQTGKFLMAKFDHFTSRPTTDLERQNTLIISDPNLHSHCVVMNVTKYKSRYQAIEGSTIHKTAQYYENLYHAHLSKGLQELGFDVRRNKTRYEIYAPGLTRRTLEKFSRRTLEIELEAKKRGITSAKRKSQLGAITRKGKSEATPNIDIKQEWFKRLTSIEKNALTNARGKVRPSLNIITAEKSIEMALAHHLERRSTVPTKILLAKAMSLGFGTLTPKDIKAALKDRQNIIYGHKRYVQYCTTKERVREEDRMLEFASRTKATMVPLYKNYTIKRDFLNAEQRKAIHKILSSPDQVSILVGGAGTGKTTVLQEVHQAHIEQGKKVFAFAQSATASRDILVQNGFKSASTLAAFMKDKEVQSRTKNQTILIDEAGLLGVGSMGKIFKIAQENNARVILVGDTAQHTSPVYGDALRLLIDKSGIEPARISEIQRQKPNPKYKAAIKELAKGNIKKGFDRLDRMGAIIEIENIRERHAEIAKAYMGSLKQKRSALVISPTHKEGEYLSEVIRQTMKVHGRIKGGEKEVSIQKIIAMSGAQKKDTAQYESGMMIQFFQNVKEFRAGEKYEVIGQEQDHVYVRNPKNPEAKIKLPTGHTERFQVYRADSIKIASGDQVRITQNGKTKEHQRIYNGQIYEVQGFTKKWRHKIKGR